MSQIKRVYVAGALTPRGRWSKNPAIDYIINCREMVKWGAKVLLAGFDPFVPALDWQLWWGLEEGQYITEPMIKRYSKSWLEVCDAMLLTPGWVQSTGTIAEKEFAEKRGIPVFDSLDKLIKVAKESNSGQGV